MTALHEEPIGDQLRRGVDELRGVREEVADFLQDVRGLAQKEVELARAEMSEQVSYLRNAVILGVATSVIGLLVLAFAATTVMFALDEAIPLWLAALITTAGLLVLALMLGLLAFAQVRQITVTPKKTMESVNEDVRWARDRMNFSAR